MKFSLRQCLFAGLVTSLVPGLAAASTVSTYYGDDDGFGVGETSGVLSDPFTSNTGVGEDSFTDMTLISSGPWPCSQPDGTCGAFIPTGSFSPFSVNGTISAATLTLRLGSFTSGSPLDGPNVIYLDGQLVDSAFINGFSSVADHDNIETMSIALDPSFFPLLADGSVSLAGTLLSESPGSHRFQVDFLSLDIQVVPVPAAVWLFGSGLVGLIAVAKRRKPV